MRKKLWILILAALTLLVGCERRPLEAIYRSTVRVIVKCIWEVHAYPKGMRPSGVTSATENTTPPSLPPTSTPAKSSSPRAATRCT